MTPETTAETTGTTRYAAPRIYWYQRDLGERQRKARELRALGLTCAQIGRVMGVSAPTAWRLQRDPTAGDLEARSA